MSMQEEKIVRLLREAKRIAMVGLSDDPRKDSFQVGAYLQSQGYELIPVNPQIEETLGRKACPSLQQVEGPVDIVDVFRRSEAVPGIADDILQMNPKPKLVWLQLGVRNDQAKERLEKEGIPVVQDVCIKMEHQRLLGKEKI